MSEWRKVFATHEEKQELARGPWLGDSFPGVALPCSKAYGLWVALRFGDKLTYAQSVEVGPWCTDDAAYVFGVSRPRAELFKGEHISTTLTGNIHPSIPDGNGGFTEVEKSNGAGIDIFPRVAHELGIPIGTNVTLEWRFAELP